ncbi:MAG: tyrosine--tRNA ligase [Rhodospirillales bacterium]|nr:tyrosine--tRNA ligase [Rhodospirillales bacterium]
MTNYRSEFVRAIVERGFLHQCTDLEALDERAAQGPITAYIGFDCTAPSLHVGSMVPIMLLRLFQQTGHKPVVLMGGGTTKVGDPSGKDESRRMLTEEKISENMAGIKQVFSKFLTFGDGPTDAIMVNNDDWLKNIQYVDFLREYGPHFTINRMMAFDSVKLRLEREQPLTFLEFNYMILQAYDFLELNRRNDCTMQMGGSDQWGNIINGVELIRRVDSKPAFGLTVPLMTTTSGAKMGKTADGAIWLNEDMLSPYDYWQYWRNTEDADVGKFLRLFTDMPLEEIAKLEKAEGTEINEVKKILATAATTLCHGNQAALAAEETARKTFEEGKLGADLPTFEVLREGLEAGITAFQLFRKAELASSGGEAKRLIKGGGAKLNDVAIKSETQEITLQNLNADGVIKLSAGKKRHAIIKPV